MTSSKLVLLALILLLAGNLAIIANQYQSLKAFNSESESLNQKLISAQNKYKTNIEKIGFLINSQTSEKENLPEINSAKTINFPAQASYLPKQKKPLNNKQQKPLKSASEISINKLISVSEDNSIQAITENDNKTNSTKVLASNNQNLASLKLNNSEKKENEIKPQNNEFEAEDNNFKPKRCFNYQ